MTPSPAVVRHAKEDCVVGTIDTPLGPLVAGALSGGICLLEYTTPGRLEPQIASIQRKFACGMVPGRSPHLERLRDELAAYFAGTLTMFTVPLVISGTPFQERAWKALLDIPYGETRSYDEQATVLGAAGAQRAIGHANGRNRIAIVIPCHRVINKSGKLGGYGGELWRKQALLRLESGGGLFEMGSSLAPIMAPP